MQRISKRRQVISRSVWHFKRIIWNGWTTIKYRLNKLVRIPAPQESGKRIEVVSLERRLKEIPVRKVRVASHIPRDEVSWRSWPAFRSWLRQGLYWFQHRVLQRFLSPMKKGLPPIDADHWKALDAACTRRHRKLFSAPELPAEYTGDVDLARLAVASPYACYLQKVTHDSYEWNFRQFERYAHRDGLHSLGVHVLFQMDREQRLRVVQIDSELGISKPDDPKWELSRKIALCAATTHMSVVRHLNWVHLIGASAAAIATRNNLPAEHPVRRLLWPHVYGTQDSNLLAIKSQLTPGGDFGDIFSFEYQDMCRLLDDTHDQFDISRFDPEEDARQRGIPKYGFATPVLDNRQELFQVMHAHAERYLRLYYTDEGIRRDEHLGLWLLELERLLPNGTTKWIGGNPTLAGVSRLVAAIIYLESVEHEAIGTGLWHYQLWPHVQPVRVYRNGQRLPLDIYQRLVNANFILNVKRTSLLEDFSYLALDNEGASAMRTFQDELQALQSRMAAGSPALWQVTPNILEANINA
ncbi:lipoxygenase family protein [Archangium lansingense]|uniref:Lipoxygenase family protein n=1 Tax=Archangium lansingense TaxID=2995310 RepID=A0ABT4A9L8_9BACT|nr:lipoxygenase family protein [Archangium lansinium]MCY1078357.1 lipoxygenase family protein [Archangium lansinium]